MSGGGADLLANEISKKLLEGEDFDLTLPDFNGDEYKLPETTDEGLYAPVARLENKDLTTKVIGGEGTFDYLMDGFKVHLRSEYEQNRITGEQYTKAYIALVEGAMGNATQFLLGKDAAYWNAVGAQLQARSAEIAVIAARVMLASEKTKLQTLRLEAATAEATFALTKLKLATESVSYDTAKYQLDNILPVQKQLAEKQIEQATAEIDSVSKRTLQTVEETKGIVANNELAPLRKSMLEKQIAQQTIETVNAGKQGVLLDNEAAMQPQKVDMLAKQILGQTAQNSMIAKQVENLQQEINLGPDKLILLKRQVDNQVAQTANVTKQLELLVKELELQPYKLILLKEQAESQRAQTLDNRSDNVPVSGAMGQQKQLYAQQIVSYKRDAEMKAVKVFVDAWTVMKTIDEGLAPPDGFSNANLNAVLATMKANNGL